MLQNVHNNYYYYIRLTNGLFSRTAWVSWHQKGKPFWILLEQDMMGWQWHQLDHMQIICTSLHTDNHANTSPLSFLHSGCPCCRPTNSVKALKVNKKRAQIASSLSSVKMNEMD